MAGVTFGVRVVVSGWAGGDYELIVDGGQSLAVRKGGGLDAPLFCLQVSESGWNDVISGAIPMPAALLQPALLARRPLYDRLRALRGTLHLEVIRPNAAGHASTHVFNATPEPSVNLMVKLADHVALLKGQITPVEALTAGKLRFHGDWGLLAALGKLFENGVMID